MSRGFIAVSRGIFDHPSFPPEPFTEREAWIWLIDRAAWKDTWMSVGRTSIAVKRGQCAFALRYLAEKWKWSDSKVRRWLKTRTEHAQVIVQATRDATIITVCNYDKHQGLQRAEDAQTDAQHEAQTDAKKNQLTNNHKPESTAPSAEPTSREKKSKRKPEVALPSDWTPSDSHRAYAKELGLSESEFGREVQRFRNNAAQNDRRARDWAAAFRNWLLKAAEFLGKPALKPSGGEPADIFVRIDSPRWGQLSARWREANKANTGPPARDYPSGTGWYFPRDWTNAA